MFSIKERKNKQSKDIAQKRLESRLIVTLRA